MVSPTLNVRAEYRFYAPHPQGSKEIHPGAGFEQGHVSSRIPMLAY